MFGETYRGFNDLNLSILNTCKKHINFFSGFLGPFGLIPIPILVHRVHWVPAEVYPCDPVGLQMLTAAVAEMQFFKRTLIEDISLRHFLHRGGLATAATE